MEYKTTDYNPHLLTPEEAEKKYCPLKYSDCIGTKCMAWRWAKITDYSQINPTERYSPFHGYCGMVRNG